VKKTPEGYFKRKERAKSIWGVAEMERKDFPQKKELVKKHQNRTNNKTPKTREKKNNTIPNDKLPWKSGRGAKGRFGLKEEEETETISKDCHPLQRDPEGGKKKTSNGKKVVGGTDQVCKVYCSPHTTRGDDGKRGFERRGDQRSTGSPALNKKNGKNLPWGKK